MTIDMNPQQQRVDVEKMMKRSDVPMEIEAQNLHNALVNALHFMPGRADHAPEILHSVHLRYDHEKRSLTAYATDRYSIIAVLVEVMSHGQDWEAAIPQESAKQLVAILKQWQRTSGPRVALSLSEGRLESDPKRLTVSMDDHDLYSCETAEGEFPKISGLFKLEATPGARNWASPTGYPGLHNYSGLNPKFLQRVTRVKDQRVSPSKQDKSTYLGTAHAAGKTVFWVGNWCVGLIMPTRLLEGNHPGGRIPSWV